MRHFNKILVANRGEIALRVMRTCHKMGIATVAIYSDVDRDAPHVRFADEGAWIGEAPSSQSYLDSARIIRAARELRADAIHPGYGFLAENADFATQCGEAGLVFIGPSPESIRQMGSKIEARKLMASHGVPVIPGYTGEEQDANKLYDQALELGLPVLIKASAGGGGKGMRIVRDAGKIPAALESARREAANAFGDDTLLLEKYIETPRHVEFQILGDQHGHLIHIFERECSIQRRHQKIIEESPSVALTPELRQRMAEAAVAAGKAIGYFNAGTVEFILDPAGDFYFLEVNTRLQVEHPVTEGITGLDLVRLQIEIAEGAVLELSQESLRSQGHAAEARVYAEDPSNAFLPATGTLLDWHFEPTEGVRVDAGVEKGSEVGIHYDPMLAKVIATGQTRAGVTRKLARALRGMSIQGLRTNRDFLIRVLEHPAYQKGDIHTHFIEMHLPPEELEQDISPEAARISAVAAMLYGHFERCGKNQILPDLVPGFRNNRYRDARETFRIGEDELELTYRAMEAHSFRVVGCMALMDVNVTDFGPNRIRMEINGVQRNFRVVTSGSTLYVHSSLGSIQVECLPRFPEKEVESDPGDAVAPMPGKVLRVSVVEGQEVLAGEALVTLEAMKMEHTLLSPMDGIIERILVEEGALVDGGSRLLHVVSKADESSA